MLCGEEEQLTERTPDSEEAAGRPLDKIFLDRIAVPIPTSNELARGHQQGQGFARRRDEPRLMGSLQGRQSDRPK